ncbi:MAG: hypothetical protein OHK0039_32700 [Bacteroidia bacterium]
MIRQLKSAVKHHATFHKQGTEKNIFLFSMPRSGTTWLMEIIASQPGFKVVNEPFNLRKEVVRENLGIDDWDELFAPENQSKIASYLQHFIDGRDHDLRFFRYAPFSEFWKLRTHRIIFKVLFVGEANIDWYRTAFNAEVIYLLRHPVPVSLSRTEFPRLRSFIESDYHEHFSREQLLYAQQVIQRGDKYEQAVLDWCFQNAVPLRQATPDWLVLSYEQMVIEPERIIEHMVARFQFERPEWMYARVDKASNSTAKSNTESRQVLLNQDAMRQNRSWLIEKWANKVTQTQLDKTFEMLEVFEIDFYERGNFMPQDQYLLR